MSWTSIYNRALNAGAWKFSSQLEKSRTRVRNALPYTAIIIAGSVNLATWVMYELALIDSFLMWTTQALGSGFIVLLVVILIANARGNFFFSQWLVANMNPLYLGSISMVFGQEADFEFLLIATLPISFMIATPGDSSRWVKLYSTLLHILAFVFLTWYNYNHHPLITIESVEARGFMIAISRFAVLSTIVLFILIFFRLMSKAEAEAESARKKSDALLLNILPAQVADELKERGHSPPVRIPSATVLFTDFVGFTGLAEAMPPEQVVQELDICFSQFDRIAVRFGLEKLKTIGDGFMCAGGIPQPNRTHGLAVCLAALHIVRFMQQQGAARQAAGQPVWDIRIGVHSGPLVAGVVGQSKFAYDVWGDTVNTASRMESSGSPGKINISSATRQLVEPWFETSARGLVDAKGKGEMEMYYLEKIRRGFAGDDAGIEPNGQLESVLAAS